VLITTLNLLIPGRALQNGGWMGNLGKCLYQKTVSIRFTGVCVIKNIEIFVSQNELFDSSVGLAILEKANRKAKHGILSKEQQCDIFGCDVDNIIFSTFQELLESDLQHLASLAELR
jgi:hypothetical protein